MDILYPIDVIPNANSLKICHVAYFVFVIESIPDKIAVNISSVNDPLNIFTTKDSLDYTVKNGYAVPLNGLQIADNDLNQTNTELLLVNITTTYNKIGLYALNGLHFKNIENDTRFHRTSRYSALNFHGTVYSINEAFRYLYFHSTNTTHCGMDTVNVHVTYFDEMVNISLNVNVTC